MKAIRAEFVEARRPKVAQWWALLACAAACACGALYFTWERLRLLDLQHALAQAQAEAADRALAGKQRVVKPSPAYETSASELLANRQVPWPQAFVSLETSAIYGVTPTAIEVIRQERAIKVDLTVTEPTALLDYLDHLNAGLEKGDSNVWRWELKQVQRNANGGQTAVMVGQWLPVPQLFGSGSSR